MADNTPDWHAPEIPTATPAGPPAHETPHYASTPYGQPSVAPAPYGAAAPAPEPYGLRAQDAYAPQDPYASQAHAPDPYGLQASAQAPYSGGGTYPAAPGQPGYPGQWAPRQPYAKQGQAIVITALAGVAIMTSNLFAILPLVFGILALTKGSTDPENADKYVRWGWISHIVIAAVVVLLVVAWVLLMVFGILASGSSF